MLLHREASPILADAYDLHASAAERNLLLRDFYGKEVALFDSASIQKVRFVYLYRFVPQFLIDTSYHLRQAFGVHWKMLHQSGDVEC